MEEKREIVAKFHEMMAENPKRSIRGIAKILKVPDLSLAKWARGNG